MSATAATLGALLLPGASAAQETGTPLSPAGRLRVQAAPVFASWDSRFGLREEDGRVVEETEPLGFDLTRPSALALFPGATDLQATLRELTGDAQLQAVLGESRGQVTQDRIRVPVRVDLGVTDWLTVGVTVPFVKARTEILFGLEADSSNLGANPLLLDAPSVRAFVSDLERALGAVQAGAAAPELAEDLEAYAAGLRELYATSALVPAQGTAPGEALATTLAGLNARLVAAGVDTVAVGVPLPAQPITDEAGLQALLETGGFGYTAPLSTLPAVWELGDVELHAAVRLLSGALRDSVGAPARLRWEVGAGALLRLGTGTPDRTDLVLHLGSGDGQTDVEGRVFAGLEGRWFGLRLDARRGLPFSTTLPRRAAAPSRVLAPAATLTDVEWTPGAYTEVELTPRLYLTPELAVLGAWRYRHRGAAEYRGAIPAPPEEELVFVGAPGSVAELERETEATVHHLGGGLRFSTLEAWRDGRTGLPFEVSFVVQSAVSGSGGATPESLRAQVAIRLYRRLWGG